MTTMAHAIDAWQRRNEQRQEQATGRKAGHNVMAITLEGTRHATIQGNVLNVCPYVEKRQKEERQPR